MVQASGLGFGGGIDLREIFLLMQALFIILTLAQVSGHPELNIGEAFIYYVLGYPECRSTLCFLPSQENWQRTQEAMTDLFTTGLLSSNNAPLFSIRGTNPNFRANLDPLGSLFAMLDTLKGVIGLLVVIADAIMLKSFLDQHNEAAGMRW